MNYTKAKYPERSGLYKKYKHQNTLTHPRFTIFKIQKPEKMGKFWFGREEWVLIIIMTDVSLEIMYARRE
jgi:hypothetical protein